MYNAWVTDPYAANAMHSEIVTDLSVISANIKIAKAKKDEAIFEDIGVIIEKILSRDPIPSELACRTSSDVYNKLLKEVVRRNKVHTREVKDEKRYKKGENTVKTESTPIPGVMYINEV